MSTRQPTALLAVLAACRSVAVAPEKARHLGRAPEDDAGPAGARAGARIGGGVTVPRGRRLASIRMTSIVRVWRFRARWTLPR